MIYLCSFELSERYKLCRWVQGLGFRACLREKERGIYLFKRNPWERLFPYLSEPMSYKIPKEHLLTP